MTKLYKVKKSDDNRCPVDCGISNGIRNILKCEGYDILLKLKNQ